MSSGSFVPTNFKDIEVEPKHKSCVLIDSENTSENLTQDETAISDSQSKFAGLSDLTSQANVFDQVTESRATSRKDSMSMIGDIDSEFEISLAAGKEVKETQPMFNKLATIKPFVPTAKPAPFFKPKSAPQQNSGISAGLNDLKIQEDFTPSTPYVHKFRTELCKNWSLYGKCKYGDEVSIHLISERFISWLI